MDEILEAIEINDLQVDFTLSIGEGRLDASVIVPAGQTTLTQILPAI